MIAGLRLVGFPGFSSFLYHIQECTFKNMWQGSGCPAKVGGFPWVLQFPLPHLGVRLEEHVY